MSVCDTCGREIIWLRLRDGSTVACDATLRSISELPLDAVNAPNLTSLITDYGVTLKKEFLHPDAIGSGYVPHFYSCDNAAALAATTPLFLDRTWLGDPSVGPAKDSEGGSGELE